ncbi:unnamed protein product, partial [Didymodactylos carnosus]
MSAEPRVASHAPLLVKEGEQYLSTGINLNHNMLSGNLETFPELVNLLLVDPNMLQSLDLSFNMFNEVPA